MSRKRQEYQRILSLLVAQFFSTLPSESPSLVLIYVPSSFALQGKHCVDYQDVLHIFEFELDEVW